MDTFLPEETTPAKAGSESGDVSAKKHDLKEAQSTSQEAAQQVQDGEQAEAETTLPCTQAQALNTEQQTQPGHDLPVPVPPSPPSPGSPLRLGGGQPVGPSLFPAPVTPPFSRTTTGLPPSPPSPDRAPTLSLPPPPEVEPPSPAKPKDLPDTRTLYEILGVANNASSAELRKAYLTRSKQVHPDKHKGDPGSTVEFQKLSNAYNILTVATKRFEYDLSLTPAAKRAAAPKAGPKPRARGKGKAKAKASPKHRFSPTKASPKPKATPKGGPKRKAKAKPSPKAAAETPKAKKGSKRKAKSPPVTCFQH